MRKTVARWLHRLACWIAPDKARLTLRLNLDAERALHSMWDELRQEGIEIDPYVAMDFYSGNVGSAEHRAFADELRKHLH